MAQSVGRTGRRGAEAGSARRSARPDTGTGRTASPAGFVCMKHYLPRSRMSAKLVAGPSRIHGDGIIAAEAIKRGEKLMEFGGEVISVEQANGGLYREQ